MESTRDDPHRAKTSMHFEPGTQLPQTIRISSGDSVRRTELFSTAEIEMAARRYRSKLWADLGRQFATYLRTWFNSARTAWRHYVEVASLLDDDGRAAQDLGLGRGEVFAALVHPWWSRTSRRLREAAARRRADAMLAAARRRAASARKTQLGHPRGEPRCELRARQGR